MLCAHESCLIDNHPDLMKAAKLEKSLCLYTHSPLFSSVPGGLRGALSLIQCRRANDIHLYSVARPRNVIIRLGGPVSRSQFCLATSLFVNSRVSALWGFAARGVMLGIRGHR